jgi:DNA modification methylase
MFPIQHEFIFVFGTRPLHLIPTVPNTTAGTPRNASAMDRGVDGTMPTIKRALVIRPFRELGTVIEVQAVATNQDHPAQFPVDLAAEYIRAFDGDVFDPFAGAGTTLIASEQLGRRCRCIDIAPAYCQTIIDRWEAFTGGTALKVGEAVRP